MTFKKELTKALTTDGETTININNLTYLRRWTRDWANKEVDCLTITFGFISGIKGGMTYDIKARDYEGILDEIEKYTKEYYLACADETVKNLKNGYR